MAEAPRGDRGGEPDAAKIINHLKDWSSRIAGIPSETKKGDGFLEDIEETLSKTLKDQQACLQKMLEDGSFSEDVDHSYQLACNLINEIENKSRDQNVNATPKIKEGLKRLKERLLAFHVQKSRQALGIIKCLKDWSSCLNTWKSSQNKSETELENILQSLENPSASKRRVSESTYKISDMSQEIKELLDWLEQYRWPQTMSKLLGCIEREVELLMDSFDDVLDNIEANSMVDRMKGMREAMDGILKYIINKSGYERIPEMPMLKTSSEMIYERTAMGAEVEPLPEQSTNHEVIVELNPNEELIYVCTEDNQRVITFPAGTVDSPQKALIKFEPVKENTILLTEVAGFSDTICIHHDKKFLKPVRVKIPLKSMEEDDFTECELYCVTIGDEMTINEDVHVTLLSDNVCSFETIDFSKKGTYAKYPKKKVQNSKNLKENMDKFAKEIKQLHGHGSYNILIFIGIGYQEDTWRAHVEVVHEKDIKDTITKRRNGMNLIELSGSRSPNVNIEGVEKIEVTLGQKGPLALCWERRYFIEVIPGGHSIFVTIPVKRINKENMATIHCKAIKKTSTTSKAKPKGNLRNTKGNDYLYIAHFDPRDMSICKPQPIRDYVSDVGRPVAQNIIPDTTEGFNRPASRTKTTITPSSSLSSIETSQQAANINFFGDKSMLCLAKQINPNKMWEVAVNLEIPDTKYKDFEHVYKNSPNKLKTNLLMYWHENRSCPDKEKVSQLCSALEEADLTLTADTVKQVFNENRPLEKKDFQN